MLLTKQKFIVSLALSILSFPVLNGHAIDPADSAGVSRRDCRSEIQSISRSSFDLSLPPRSLQRTSKHELKVAGKKVKSFKDLNNLVDGVYIFLIDEEANIYFSPRVPDLNANPSGEFMATHRSLFEKISYSSTLGDQVEIFAGGEFQIRNGKPYGFNNKTGTFPTHNDAEHLRMALVIFQEQGLDFSRAMIVDISILVQRNSGDKPAKIRGLGAEHLEEEQEAILRLKIHQSEELRQLRAKLVDSLERVYKMFPGQGGLVEDGFDSKLTDLGLGLERLDSEPDFEFFNKTIKDSEEYKKKLKSYYWALFQFLNYMQKESPEFMISKFTQSSLFESLFGKNTKRGIEVLSNDLVKAAEYLKALETSE